MFFSSSPYYSCKRNTGTIDDGFNICPLFFQDAIIEVVDFVCAHMPGVLADDCIGFIEQYGDAIIKLLVHELSPKTVCQQIKLCKPPSFESKFITNRI